MTPARSKFLKSKATELRWISQVFTAYAGNAPEAQWFPAAGYCIVASLVSTLVFFSFAAFILHRRNLHT